jgi:hypothetical protein
VDRTATDDGKNALEIAAELGMPYGRVVADLVRGRLKGKRVGREWIVTRADLAAYVARWTAKAVPAVERFGTARVVSEEVRTWWQGAMRTAQTATAAAARAYADHHAALTRSAARGRRAAPKAVEAFEDVRRALAAALRRVEALDEIYGTVVRPLEAEALRTAREATEAVGVVAVARRSSPRVTTDGDAVRGSDRRTEVVDA